MENDVATTLAQRETTYGDFAQVAEISQQLKSLLYSKGASAMPAMHREAIDMICSKLARICNGDPNYKDSWHDIAGYAKLVEDRL